jgi:hypothetical protein
MVLLTPQLGNLITARPASTDRDSELDLAAYIDYEQQEGMLAAIRTYPHVWIALLRSNDLAETYRMTRTLLDAERNAELQPMAQAVTACCTQGQPENWSLRLQRGFFNQALMVLPPSLGLTRGAGENETVLIDNFTNSGIHMSLSMQQHSADTWDITMTVTPPLKERLVLKLGTAVFRAPFDMYGVAVIPGVSAELLTAPDGPDLVVGLEPDEARDE